MATDVFNTYSPFKGVRTTPQADFGDAFTESLKMSYAETPFQSLLSGLELEELQKGTTEGYAGLNEEFDLDLSEDTTRAYAEKVRELKNTQQRRQKVVDEGFSSSPKMGMVAGFGATLLAEGSDPINIGSTLALGFGASKIFSLASGVAKPGLIANTIKSTGQAMKANPITASMAEGVAGNLLADQFVVYGNELKQSEVDMYELLAVSASMGALFPLLGGLIGKAFKRADAKFKGGDTEPVPRKDILVEEKGSLLADSRASIEASNKKFDDLEAELRTAEAKSQLTPLQARERNIELDRIRGEIRNVKEFRKFVLRTEKDLSKSEFEISKRVTEIEKDIIKTDAEIKEIDAQPKSRTLDAKRKEQIQRKSELVSRKKTLEESKELTTKTRDSVINRDKQLYDLDKLLFNNKDFDFATLKPDQHASLLEWHKRSINGGLRPDVEGAVNAIHKQQVLPAMEKEIVEINKIPELNAEQKNRLEYLETKTEEIRNFPDPKKTDAPNKLYEKSDPDETYHNMPVDEMEEKVFKDTVIQTEQVQKNLKDTQTEANMALECLLGSL